jgi:hypothetical protein
MLAMTFSFFAFDWTYDASAAINSGGIDGVVDVCADGAAGLIELPLPELELDDELSDCDDDAEDDGSAEEDELDESDISNVARQEELMEDEEKQSANSTKREESELLSIFQ